MTLPSAAEADRATRNSALTLACTLPGDTVLYLLLPLHAAVFGVTLPEVGILLAANRLVRIAGYGWVARFYGERGPRSACMLAAVASALSAFGYAALSGLWALLVARLLWGLAFAAMNIAVQALPTALPEGAARRSGWSRSIVAAGPMIGLLGGAVLAEWAGPRLVFVVLGLVSLPAIYFAACLPATPEGQAKGGPRFALPNAFNIWAFVFGLTMDGLFVIGLSVLAAAALPEGATLAAGGALALRYAAEIFLAPAGGWLAGRLGARQALVGLSLATACGLLLLAAGGVLLWAGALATVLLRAIIQPLPGPVVAAENPGPGRVPALAQQATWRDIGAGAGPLLAGILLPIAPALLIYGGGAAMLAVASLGIRRPR
ncbi:MFS transporter [Roseomonas xinghualingensis]|uniref:MFS transporter n=1 Tax=Roseomonas xinghualingensis TaxID=2986475 RepID=UPI0021F12518|nr:MFS transporter [Roseomonas sp. SXEYE001]MCV4207850.1 MFS transporter [Roseomonas sp. SXEYE001]